MRGLTLYAELGEFVIVLNRHEDEFALASAGDLDRLPGSSFRDFARLVTKVG
jgi:hypothetical protein